MFHIAKKAVFVGLGLSGRLKEIVDELAEKGQENQSGEARRVKAFIESIEKRCEHRKDDWDQKINTLCSRVLNKVSLPTKDDFNRLEKELHDLSGRFRQQQEEGSASRGSASTTGPQEAS